MRNLNIMKLLITIVAALVLTAGWAGYAYVQQVRERQEAEAAAAAAKTEALAAAERLQKAELLRPRADRPMTVEAVPPQYPRPLSDWSESEKEFYSKLLADAQFDVLIVPFQVQEWGFDLATRSVMAGLLARTIAQAQKTRVLDPFLAAKVLGEGQRRFSKDDVYRLADHANVKRIITGYAGHNRSGKMAITIVVQDRPSARTAEMNGVPWNSPATTSNFENIVFDDKTTPLDAYASALPNIASALGIEPAQIVQQTSQASLDIADLAASPLKFVSGDGNPARDAYGFLLFGLLTPDHIGHTKQQFAAKAYLAVLRLSPQSPEYRALHARALMALGYRQAAINALKTPQADEDRELLAALNGNLPEVRASMAKEKNPLKRLIQSLDESNIASDYGVIGRKDVVNAVKALRLPGETWPLLAARALGDWDQWVQQENAVLKVLLDREFPIKGYSLEEMVRGAAAVGGGMENLQGIINLSVINHSRKYLDAQAQRLCCLIETGKIDEMDYLDLIVATAHDNLVRRINFLSEIQGQPEAALKFANSIDAAFKGYPYYAFARAKAEAKLASTSSGAAKQGLIKSAYQDAFNAMYWDQGQSLISAGALGALISLGRSDYGYMNNFYSTDVPYRPYYTATWTDGGKAASMIANAEAALKNSCSNFWVVRALLRAYGEGPGGEELLAQLLKSLDGRFVGSPERGEILAKIALDKGDIKTAEDLDRENIQIAPGYWRSYKDLGTLLFENGKIADASKVILSYPGFKIGSGEDRVAIVNAAYEPGSLFYWSGHFDLALPLYRIAAAQGTGAGGEIASATRMKLLSGDYNAAMAGSLERAQRYNDPNAYRDYLGMLHATGHSKEAWAGFNMLVRELGKPQIWETALVGHHMAGATESDVSEWAKQDGLKVAGGSRNFAAAYLLRFAVTDRTPSKEVSSLIDAMDLPTWSMDEWGGRTMRPGADNEFLGQGAGVPPGGKSGSPGKRRVKSDLTYFAEGYRAIKLGDYAAAKSSFDEAAVLYNMFEEHAEYMLPYYAFAAAKSGDTAGIEKVLARFTPQKQRFNYQLARAVLLGIGGKPDEALDALILARYRRPYTEDRPLVTEYTFGEICDLLADATGNGKIRQLALEWARANERSQPWQSWSYALEAKLTRNPADRKRAIAMTQYLDPKSEQLSKFKKPEIDDATKSYARSNPFLRKSGTTSKEDST